VQQSWPDSIVYGTGLFFYFFVLSDLLRSPTHRGLIPDNTKSIATLILGSSHQTPFNEIKNHNFFMCNSSRCSLCLRILFLSVSHRISKGRIKRQEGAINRLYVRFRVDDELKTLNPKTKTCKLIRSNAIASSSEVVKWYRCNAIVDVLPAPFPNDF
jgi:hypothetical protein